MTSKVTSTTVSGRGSPGQVTGVIRLFAVVAGLVVITTALASSVSARNSASPGRIAYKHFVDDQFRQALIVTSDPDGKHRITLTHPGNGQTDDYPIWAPDGASLIFTREDFNGCGTGCDTDDIYRIDADGTGLVRVTDGTTSGVSSQFASFSPDGRRIAVQRVSFVNGNCCLSVILTLNLDGSNALQLTNPDWATTGDFEPMWSPLGDEIAFTREIGDPSTPEFQQAIFAVPVHGGDVRQVTPWSIDAGGAAYAPDGRTIAFESFRDCCRDNTAQVYTIRPDGSGMTKLTSDGRNIEPEFSPDGSQIVFAHNPGIGRFGFADIYTMDADGTNITQVTHTPLWDSEPDWGVNP